MSIGDKDDEVIDDDVAAVPDNDDEVVDDVQRNECFCPLSTKDTLEKGTDREHVPKSNAPSRCSHGISILDDACFVNHSPIE